MSELDPEKAFEDYLARRSAISGPAQEDNLEPPAELDRIVLANAREAIRMRGSQPVFRSVRWAVPVGLAATLVLSFAILLHLGRLPRPGQSLELPVETRLTDYDRKTERDSGAVASAPDPQVSVQRADAAKRSVANDKAEAAGSLREQRAQNANVADIAPPPPPSSLEQDIPAVKVAGSKEEPVAATAAAPASEAPEDPAQWLRRIRTLREQGRSEEADRQMQAFRKVWPNYPVGTAPHP